jgi:signal peptidase II
MRRIVKLLVILVFISSNIACDQVSKNIARKNIDYNEQISVAGKILTLTKVENTGAFLSLGNSLPGFIKLIFLTIIPLIILVYGVIYVISKKDLSNITVMAVTFIVGGGIGNIFDRLMYGSVTDFLHLDFGIFQTGIFNMADVSVMTGMFTLLLELYLQNRSLKSKELSGSE